MITDYDSLKQEIITWAHRDDVDLHIDTFIQLAETDMFSNPIEVLKVRGQEARSTAATSGQYLALPDDFIKMRSLRFLIPGEQWELYQRAPEQMHREPATGRPDQFTVTSQIEFNRVPDSDYEIEMQYFAKPAPLSTTNASNEVLADNPNIYLFGALAALFKWARQPQDSAEYYDQFIDSIKGANMLFKKGRYGANPQMTLEGSTP